MSAPAARGARLRVTLLGLGFGVVFAAIGATLVYQQHRTWLDSAERDATAALRFLAFVTRGELQNGQYEVLDGLFAQWASHQADVHAVRLTARNGFLIAEYSHGAEPGPLLHLARDIAYSYAGQARLELSKDLADAYAHTRQLGLMTSGLVLALTLLFTLIVHLYLGRRREAARLLVRSRELAESNQRLASTVVELEQSQVENRRLAAFPRDNPHPVVAFGPDGAVLFQNPALLRLMHELRAAQPGGVLPADHPALVRQARAGQTSVVRDYGVGGRYLRAEYHHSGQGGETFVYLRDLTQQRHTEIRLQHEQHRALVTLASIGDAVITTDSLGQIEYLNPAAEALCGIANAAAVGRPLTRILTLIRDGSGEPLGDIGARCAQRQMAIDLEDRVSLLRPDGARFPVQGSAAPIYLEPKVVRGVVVVLRDVSRERDLQAELVQRATHDSLTGLLNRYAFETHLEQALEAAHARQRSHALCFLDLDQFKVVNDTCGHVAGDELLRQLGAVLRQHVRDGDDVLARLGGDEFAVLLHDCPLPQALQRAEDLRRALCEYSFDWKGQVFRIGVSIGVTPITAATGDVGELLSAADLACYEAKDLGRNRIHLFNPGANGEGDGERRSQMHWVSRINTALAEDRFVLHGQPIVDLNQAAGPPWGVEVLLRMVGEDGGLIPPGAFLPAAERFDLMPHIDRWVIRNALALLAGCAEPPAHCFINISGPSLSDDTLQEFLRQQVAAHGIDPHVLVFEVTETAAIRNLSSSLQLITEFKALGARFALDDFGTGVSSFAYLKNLPVDYLKIDGAFVRDLDRDPMDRALVEAIHKVSRTLGLQTIAEFIETPGVLAAVRALGIDRGQGYGIAAPQPLQQLLRASTARAQRRGA